ncbi:MAG TPA: DUF4363 family protein [Peptococcaceae bacterium]|jgi:hypothetical protein|nr:DUF4363 family protein [Clostridia bacterium]HOB81449.1 DUF4363 family protein [Peptococcaceae bacterium]HPZ71844.1 DUF4363 family protein [Peptococcaceae bacterium]HQD53500.1 DUF4363 family protein [Peptococcaceae bacterium]
MRILKQYLVPLWLFLLFSFLLTLGWNIHRYLATSACTMLNLTETVEAAVKKGEWATAEKVYRQAEKKWDQISKYWPLLIHHQEIDRIEECLSRMKSFLQQRNRSDSLAEIYLLQNFLRHVPANKALKLHNIF